MKSRLALLLLVLSLPLTGAGDPSPTPPDVEPSKGWREPIETKVAQVFTARDGDAIFRAYVVDYKGQRVIASDVLATSNYKIGDTIRVFVTSRPPRQGKEPYGMLAFQVASR